MQGRYEQNYKLFTGCLQTLEKSTIQNLNTHVQHSYGLAPAYLSELVRRYEPARSLHSVVDTHTYIEKPTNPKIGSDHAFPTTGPFIWNRLPIQHG